MNGLSYMNGTWANEQPEPKETWQSSVQRLIGALLSCCCLVSCTEMLTPESCKAVNESTIVSLCWQIWQRIKSIFVWALEQIVFWGGFLHVCLFLFSFFFFLCTVDKCDKVVRSRSLSSKSFSFFQGLCCIFLTSHICCSFAGCQNYLTEPSNHLWRSRQNISWDI